MDVVGSARVRAAVGIKWYEYFSKRPCRSVYHRFAYVRLTRCALRGASCYKDCNVVRRGACGEFGQFREKLPNS